jgi:phosphate starvation-inducible PhoH-like protein
MTEKEIYLDSVSLVDLYGVNDVNANKIKQLFPKLKIITRGEVIKVMGAEEDIEQFEQLIHDLLNQLKKYNKISEEDIENLLNFREELVKKTDSDDKEIIIFGATGKPVKPKTPSQKKMVKLFDDNDMIFAIGPAGTGKTYLAIALAVRALKNKEVQRIILSRPAVEAGERLGFLPGDLKEKLDPYLQALYDAMHDMMQGRKLNDFIEQGVVQIAPLAFMRGRTLSNAVVILDEGQNTTVNQMKMFLTRMGNNSKFIITGDVTQIDLPSREQSGLPVAERILQNIPGIGFAYFDKRDIVRHRLVTPIVEAFEKNL